MAINRKRLTRQFIELLKIDSPSFCEKQLGYIVIDELKKLGIEELEIDDAAQVTGGNMSNVLARIPGQNSQAPTTILASHLDTVASTLGLNLQVNENLICTDGTTILGADNKSGVAIILEVVNTIIEKRIPTGDLILLFAVCDEADFLGAKNLSDKAIKADFSLVLDAEGLEFQVGAFCSYVFQLSIRTQGAHALHPEKSINAIQIASSIVAQADYGWIDKNTCVTYNKIQGDKKGFCIPEACIIAGEVRSSEDSKALKVISKLENLATKHVGGRAHYSLIYRKIYSSYSLRKNEILPRIVEEAAQDVGITLKPQIARSKGGTIANILNEKGVTSVAIGTGMKNIHTREEQIDLQQMESCANIVLKTSELIANITL